MPLKIILFLQGGEQPSRFGSLTVGALPRDNEVDNNHVNYDDENDGQS